MGTVRCQERSHWSRQHQHAASTPPALCESASAASVTTCAMPSQALSANTQPAQPSPALIPTQEGLPLGPRACQSVSQSVKARQDRHRHRHRHWHRRRHKAIETNRLAKIVHRRVRARLFPLLLSRPPPSKFCDRPFHPNIEPLRLPRNPQGPTTILPRTSFATTSNRLRPRSGQDPKSP